MLHPHVDFSNHAAPLLSNEGHGLFAETPPAARPEQTKTTGTLHNEQRRRFCPHEPAFCSGRSPGLARDRRHEQDRIQWYGTSTATGAPNGNWHHEEAKPARRERNVLSAGRGSTRLRPGRRGRPGARTSRPSVRFVLWSSAPPKQARPGGRAGSTFLPSPAAADCTRRPVVAPTHRNGLDRSAREVPQCSAQIVRYVATIGYMVEWVRPRSSPGHYSRVLDRRSLTTKWSRLVTAEPSNPSRSLFSALVKSWYLKVFTGNLQV
jgi:hypothetical protein